MKTIPTMNKLHLILILIAVIGLVLVSGCTSYQTSLSTTTPKTPSSILTPKSSPTLIPDPTKPTVPTPITTPSQTPATGTRAPTPEYTREHTPEHTSVPSPTASPIPPSTFDNRTSAEPTTPSFTSFQWVLLAIQAIVLFLIVAWLFRR